MKQSEFFFSGIIISLLAGFAVQPAAEAFSSADLAAVTGGQNCPHADLSHANLSGADLTGLDLTGANLAPSLHLDHRRSDLGQQRMAYH